MDLARVVLDKTTMLVTIRLYGGESPSIRKRCCQAAALSAADT